MRRRQGEKHIDVCVQGTDGNVCSFVIVWHEIHYGGKSELLVLDGTMNQQVYRRVSQRSILPWAKAISHKQRRPGLRWCSTPHSPIHYGFPGEPGHGHWLARTSHGLAIQKSGYEPHRTRLGPDGDILQLRQHNCKFSISSLFAMGINQRHMLQWHPLTPRHNTWVCRHITWVCLEITHTGVAARIGDFWYWNAFFSSRPWPYSGIGVCLLFDN